MEFALTMMTVPWWYGFTIEACEGWRFGRRMCNYRHARKHKTQGLCQMFVINFIEALIIRSRQMANYS